MGNGQLREPAADTADAADTLRNPSSRSSSASGSFSDPSSARTSRASRGDARQISKRDARPLSERAADIAHIGDPLERQRALLDLLATLGPDEFASFAEQYRNLDHYGDSRGEYDLILRSWAKVDPLGALDSIGGNRQASASVLATWAGNDPAAAERWALDHFDGDGPNPYMASVIRGVATQDVSKAAELALNMPRSRERGEAAYAISEALLMQGADAALAFPATITSDDSLRAGLVQMISDRLVQKDPERIATWLAAMDNGDVQNRAARRVAITLAGQDVTKASAWVNTLKPEARAEAARGVIPVMAASDITGTAHWVSSLAGTPGYNDVVEEFVWSCDERAPEQSAAWIQGVTDPNQQRRLYHRMLAGWAQKDASAVREWVNANNVPDDVRRRFSR